MGNFDNKAISREVDLTPVYDFATDRSSHIISEMLRQLQGARLASENLGSGSTQIVANLSRDPALVLGTVAEGTGFVITAATDDAITVEINDDTVDHALVIPAATYTAATLATEIMNNPGAAFVTFRLRAEAFATFDNKLAFRSLNGGITSQVEVKAVANDAYSIIGLTAGVTQGDAKQWDAQKTALETAVTTGISACLIMTRLANTNAGNLVKDDLTAGLPIS